MVGEDVNREMDQKHTALAFVKKAMSNAVISLTKMKKFSGREVETVQELTEKKCLHGCLAAIYHLMKENEKDFDTMILLSSFRVEHLLETHFKRADWYWHRYFLVQDRLGVWYAGSPANYSEGGKYNPLKTIFFSEDLSSILDQIKLREGGLWPDRKEIVKVATGRLAMPSPDPFSKLEKLALIDVKQLDGETTSERKEFSMREYV